LPAGYSDPGAPSHRYRTITLNQHLTSGLTTIRRLEARDGVISGTIGTALRIQRALEAGGVLFLGEDQDVGAGVRLAKPRQLSLL
jgi:hypothetical protein